MACKKDKRQPTEKEAKLLAEAEALRDKLIQVRPSVRPTSPTPRVPFWIVRAPFVLPLRCCALVSAAVHT